MVNQLQFCAVQKEMFRVAVLGTVVGRKALSTTNATERRWMPFLM